LLAVQALSVSNECTMYNASVIGVVNFYPKCKSYTLENFSGEDNNLLVREDLLLGF